MKLDTEYKTICEALLHAESEGDVTQILKDYGLLDASHWKLLGDMPNNRSMVNNQQQDPTGALVEKIVNGIDAMLIKECFLHGIPPDSAEAPPSMAAAAESFFKVREGNLANIISRERTRLAENIQLIAVGSKSDPCYLVIDKGEGQTPARFEDTFLSLVKTNKARIPFVQGKFNCGGTGVLPFCGRKAYQLIISRRCPDLPSDPSEPGEKDPTHDLWGFTLVRVVPPSEGLYDTMAYMYLAPGGKIPQFRSPELQTLPEITTEAIGEEPDEEENTGKPSSGKANPKPYRNGLKHGTVVKLYNYRWRARSLATRDARHELERYLFHLSLPVRVVECRAGFTANYFATTVSGTSVTIALDHEKGFLEDNFPLGGTLNLEGIGKLPISITLYRERSRENGNERDKNDTKKKQKAKGVKRLPKGLYFTINGQVHYTLGPEFVTTRGMNYDFLKDTLLTTVDCNGLGADIRDQLIMPSRDRLRKIPEFEEILRAIVEDLKDRPALRAINDARRLRRVKEALSQEAVQDVFQTLINKDPVFASLFQNGRGLRNPFEPGPELPKPPYKGKLPPTYFWFENGEKEITKSFAIDRTCAVELQTDAVNGYFELPDPLDRGELSIGRECYERWNLSNGVLRIVFRAPSNARIGDSLPVKITITDPCLNARGDEPWTNKVTLKFVPGGKETKPGVPRDRKPKGGESLGLPDVVPVCKAQWDDHGFNERSALRIVRKENGAYQFFVNMDNTYLHNELMRRKDLEKETVKFAFQWGLVLVSLGVLTELERHEKAEGNEESNNGETTIPSPEEQVGQFSAGIAAVIVPTVLDLLELTKSGAPQKQPEAIAVG